MISNDFSSSSRLEKYYGTPNNTLTSGKDDAIKKGKLDLVDSRHKEIYAYNDANPGTVHHEKGNYYSQDNWISHSGSGRIEDFVGSSQKLYEEYLKRKKKVQEEAKTFANGVNPHHTIYSLVEQYGFGCPNLFGHYIN